MVILLDLDGVLITTPAWRAVETEPDGFFKFNARATTNLAALLAATHAAVVLTTSHRLTYSLAQWTAFLIAAWVAQPGAPANYVVLDDDLSLHGLPLAIKNRCVITKPLLGLDADAAQRALHILRSYPAPTTLPC